MSRSERERVDPNLDAIVRASVTVLQLLKKSTSVARPAPPPSDRQQHAPALRVVLSKSRGG